MSEVEEASRREDITRRMREHHEAIWGQGDAWELQGSEFEQARYRHLLGAVADRRYERVIEIGCGSGEFTRLLGSISRRVVALDIAAAAIERARAANQGAEGVDFRVANVMEYDLHREGPWDLVVMSETIYSIGWLYPLFDVGYLASELLAATAPGGRLLLANTYGKEKDWLLRPWLIDTYRDLFRNVGYEIEREEIFRGDKHGVTMEVLISVCRKASGAPGS